jgi:hypothetical protein
MTDEKYYGWKNGHRWNSSITTMLVRMLWDVIYDSAILVFLNAKKEHREEGGKAILFPIRLFFWWIGGSIPYSFPIWLMGLDLSYYNQNQNQNWQFQQDFHIYFTYVFKCILIPYAFIIQFFVKLEANLYLRTIEGLEHLILTWIYF